MNEFDEIVAVRNIRTLFLDRAMEKTPNQVRAIVRKIAQAYRVPYPEALERLEDQLLSSNPFPEDWA